MLIVACAVSAISVTLGKAKIFAPFRAWVASRGYWLGQLVRCHYCLSHWIAFVLVPLYHWPSSVVDAIVSVFAVVAISAVISGIVIQINGMVGDPLPEEG